MAKGPGKPVVSKIRWERSRERRMLERGADPIGGAESDALLAPRRAPWRKRTTKAELRAQADAAIADWQRKGRP